MPFACLFALALAFIGIPGCAPDSAALPPLATIAGRTMGTTYTIKLSSLPPQTTAEQLQTEIDRRLDEINDQMSTYRPDSELSRFNSHAGDDWFDVSPATATVVAEARRISELTGGAFDVTVGPLVNLWSFGPETHAELPTDDEIAQAKTRIGYRRLEVRQHPPALRKTRPDLYVDLSAIAKGFAVDEIAEFLEGQGVSGSMVEIGGEIRTRGTKPDGSPWKVGIEAPLDDRRSIGRALELGDRALATSGDYRNFRIIDGKRYSHTIDPRTGRPVEHQLASVSVIHTSAMTADALATAFTVLGPEEGYNSAVESGLPVLFIVREGERFVERPTPEFQRLVENKATSSNENSSMALFVLAFIVFAVAVLVMAVGVIVGNRRLRGTCGGLAGLRDEHGRTLCDACTTPSESCRGPSRNFEQERTEKTE